MVVNIEKEIILFFLLFVQALVNSVKLIHRRVGELFVIVSASGKNSSEKVQPSYLFALFRRQGLDISSASQISGDNLGLGKAELDEYILPSP